MNPLKYFLAQVHGFRIRRTQQRVMRENPSCDEIIPSVWPRSVTSPTPFYLNAYVYFHRRLPAELRLHRQYFTQQKRGFGEDAFHVMWYLLFSEFKPKTFLEIGVYRGQTLSVASLLQQTTDGGEVFGISPFSPAGDSVSKYKADVDYYQDTLQNFAHFSLPKPNLIRAYSTDEAARQVINSREWHCIYIDGNHDYEIAKADWEICARNVKQHGLIVLDDSGCTTDYSPPLFATKGHPGPSRVADEVNPTQFREIMQMGHNRVFQKL
ncbi:MAG: class I SAM-dependent methyltransferase [Limisphaerales bacterium]